MSHHEHPRDGAYYLDQVCVVVLSAGFGGICLALYVWQTRMLDLMLARQFHNLIGASGVVLYFLAVIRAASLGAALRRRETCSTLDHEHEHNGAPAKHDHDWAPWRYVVLLIPIMLFLLGLPNKGPTGQALMSADFGNELVEGTTLVALAADPRQPLLALAAIHASEPAIPMNFKDAHGLAADPASRQQWQGKVVVVRGHYGTKNHPRLFSLLGFRRQCCGADAVQYEIPVACKEPVPTFERHDWLSVKGRVDFRLRGGTHITILLVASAAAVSRSEPDPNPFFD